MENRQPRLGGLDPQVLDPVELLSREELQALQRKKLARSLELARRAPLYRDRLQLSEEAISAAAVEGDLTGLPLTRKSELRELPSLEDALAVPRRLVRRWHSSSGTSGKRTAMAYTDGDLELWARLTARALSASGIGKGTRVHNAFGYGLFTGGLGFEGGLSLLGASVVPASGGPSHREHLELVDWFGAEALLCTPSCAAGLAETLADQGRCPSELSLQVGIFGGEGWSEGLGARIEEGLGLRAFDTYGLSEIIGPGVAHGCHGGPGLHFYEDAFLVEVLEPDSTRPVAAGQPGELVLTTLANEACPRVRYRTGDLVRVNDDPCPCGRTGLRLQEVIGRAGDALRVGSSILMPLQVERALLQLEELSSTWCIESPRPGDASLLVHAEARAEPLPTHRVSALEGLLAGKLGLDSVRVSVHRRGSLPRSLGKAQRVISSATPSP